MANMNEQIREHKIKENKAKLEFLQKKVLLCEYTEILAGKRQKFGKSVIGNTERQDPESINLMYEKRRENAFYLIRFAFQNIFGVKTLEEALKRDDIWKLAKLDRLFSGRYITLESVVNADDSKRHFITDKNVILYIIYNDYDKDILTHCFEIYQYIAENSIGTPVKEAKKELARLTEIRAERERKGLKV